MWQISLIKIGGIYCIAMVIFHLSFWKLFNWRKDLRRLTPLNRAAMQVLNLSLTFTFVIIAVISILYTNDMLTTELGRVITLLIGVLWILRAIMQPIFFGFRQLLSVGFFVFFLVGGAVYLIPLI